MLRAGIIGAGRIAWSYDGGAWDGARSLSHAACFHRHPDTRLVAIFDPDPAACAAFEAGYRGPGPVACSAEFEAFLAHDLDLVAIASPTEHHADQIKACIEAGIPRLWVEKPATADMASFTSLQTQLAQSAAPPRIVVNYFRRCLPHVSEAKSRLRSALSAGELRRLDVTYSRGLAINGVHFLDLIGYFFDADDAPALDWIDRADTADPSFGFSLSGVPVAVLGVPDLGYHALDLRAVTDGGRLSLSRGAAELTWEAKQPNPDVPGFFNLAPPVHVVPPDVSTLAMLDGSYLALCNLLDDGAASQSPFAASGFTQSILAQLSEGLR
ncbi:Gfo/Idh/MocA family protein [Gymnodinialimonas ceratoperidinii]|uniref:Gfo/Idh/MocA family oxidoreductase n=1 Tax=Gymnodinialimonas ceratoperidinii TaxID=2856823 RepID=A0A8F6Y9X3_9RHOB|nr:Gfo/Idh/MocA family oxidoreductase [Gymnodinialimonas ceratoperidinii]QXT39384.1 Gfo/Idh/MocA family oxidoreductase [Gymnodinialimonas ceratoperidinii]